MLFRGIFGAYSQICDGFTEVSQCLCQISGIVFPNHPQRLLAASRKCSQTFLETVKTFDKLFCFFSEGLRKYISIFKRSCSKASMELLRSFRKSCLQFSSIFLVGSNVKASVQIFSRNLHKSFLAAFSKHQDCFSDNSKKLFEDVQVNFNSENCS